MSRKEYFYLGLLTVGAVLVHGYHPTAEDAEIYIPGILKLLDPRLFPYNTEFFQSHAHLTLFPNLIACSVRLTQLPLEWVLLIWHVASIYLLLLACWQLIGHCLTENSARWAGVGLIAALLTIPVAGTALYIMDQYLNPRSISVFAALFAVERTLRQRYLSAGLWIIGASVVHPLMAVYALSFSALLIVMKSGRFAIAVLLLPLGISFGPPSPAYHQAALLHSFHYFTKWAWYEQLGAIAPLFILWWFARIPRTKDRPALALLCRALAIYGLIYLVGGLVLSIPARFEALARFQPMRSLHLLYVIFFLIAGGLLGEFVLKKQLWGHLLLFVPLCAGMFYAQRQLFPATAHIEMPGAASRNEWVQAFQWIRANTPVDAYFALDPVHMSLRGEDEQGFRAIARRSMLADMSKDSGAVSMFPQLAGEWWAQVSAERDWPRFGLTDFQNLRARYGVDWIVVKHPAIAGLDCPYSNSTVSVCRIPTPAPKE